MTSAWTYLDVQDRETLRATIAFLSKRLADAATFAWALQLSPTQRIERLAIEELLDSPAGHKLAEPWSTAWSLIEESWSNPAVEEGPPSSIYGIQRRLRAGNHSGAIISKIIALVSPQLKVEPIGALRRRFLKQPRRPQTFEDLLSAKLTSGGLIDLKTLELGNLTDIAFLQSLGSRLDASVSHGLEIARRLGWDGKSGLWKLGGLGRVYYVTATSQEAASKDPDVYHQGIAPSVKLLYAVVARIAKLNTVAAAPFIQRWRSIASPIYIRLWAAAARSKELASAGEVGEFLIEIENRPFWDLNEFPEIAELRALRYCDLDQQFQLAVSKRLRKGPPNEFWPGRAGSKKNKDIRLYWTIRELKRIEVAGSQLLPEDCALIGNSIERFSDLRSMKFDKDFPETSEAYWVPANPDSKFDALSGPVRLRALEHALSANRVSWDDDPSERANDWIQQPGKSSLVLNDFETVTDSGDEFPRVWNRFGWAHASRKSASPKLLYHDLQAEADRVLTLLNQLSTGTLAAAIEGVSAWLDAWAKQVAASSLGLSVWLRVWPIAVEATDWKSDSSNDADLSVVARVASEDQEPMDLDTLNTPAGKLVGVFLAGCPPLSEVSEPFKTGSRMRQLRDVMMQASGRSGLIVRHRLIESLPYFLGADRKWSEEYLIAPLLADNAASLALWRAIARRTQFTDVLKIIGAAMVERAADRRLGREARRMLVFSLVVECMHAFREGREPAVPNQRVQQMLRTLDDEVRASAADAIQQFIRQLSAKKSDEANPPSAAELFRSSVAPFLQQVWPQERSLSTPGVSGAFADLPATSEDAFAEAVHAIERFLVPFECWSMINYGLYSEGEEKKKLAVIINSEANAAALLRLLDLTIGSSEGAVIPHDLTEALDQIRSVAPVLTGTPVFRRLSTAARR